VKSIINFLIILMLLCGSVYSQEVGELEDKVQGQEAMKHNFAILLSWNKDTGIVYALQADSLGALKISDSTGVARLDSLLGLINESLALDTARNLDLDSLASAIVGGEMKVSIGATSDLATEDKQDSILAELGLIEALQAQIRDGVTLTIPDSLTAMHVTANLAKAGIDSLVAIITDVYDASNGVLKTIDQAPLSAQKVSAQTLFTAAAGDTCTTVWKSAGELAIGNHTFVRFGLTQDLGTCSGMQIKVVGLNTTGGTEYSNMILTVASDKITAEEEVIEFTDADQTVGILWDVTGYDYCKVYYKATTAGDGQWDLIEYTLLWR